MNLNDSFGLHKLCQTHGVTPDALYVILSADGSTLMRDPGLDQAYCTPIKKLAEETAALATKAGHKCYATDFETALKSVLRHPKNQPPDRKKQFKLS
jgi:hypothetical protein